MKKYLCFLDIDGVFTSARVHTAHNSDGNVLWTRFDPVAIDFFNYIHDTYSIETVLISTWKNHLRNDDGQVSHWVRSAFSNSGFRGIFADLWKTDPDNLWVNKTPPYNRAHEIRDYLVDRDDVEDYIIFDDNDYRFKEILGKQRLVRTDPDNGLLHKHMLNAKSIMGAWEKKK